MKIERTPYHLILVLLLTIHSAPGETAEDILGKSASLDQLPKYRAQFETLLPTNLSKSMRTHGVVCGAKRSDGPKCSRTETITEAQDAQGNTLSKLVVYSITVDGNNVVLLPDQKRAVIIDTPQKKLSDLLTDSSLFSLELREERFQDKSFHVVTRKFSERGLESQRQLTAAANAGNSNAIPATLLVGRQEEWIDGATDIISRELTYNANGLFMGGIEYTNIEISPKLPDELFEIPAGYAVVNPKNNTEVLKLFTEAQTFHHFVNKKMRYVVIACLLVPVVFVFLKNKRKFYLARS